MNRKDEAYEKFDKFLGHLQRKYSLSTSDIIVWFEAHKFKMLYDDIKLAEYIWKNREVNDE